jgi:hypothetical protein
METPENGLSVCLSVDGLAGNGSRDRRRVIDADGHGRDRGRAAGDGVIESVGRSGAERNAVEGVVGIVAEAAVGIEREVRARAQRVLGLEIPHGGLLFLVFHSALNCLAKVRTEYHRYSHRFTSSATYIESR